ncbi:CoA transferase, partial [Mycobacterium tuberculosis]
MWLTLIDDAVTELRRHDLRRYAVEGVNGRRKAGTFMAGPLSGLRVVEL